MGSKTLLGFAGLSVSGADPQWSRAVFRGGVFAGGFIFMKESHTRQTVVALIGYSCALFCSHLLPGWWRWGLDWHCRFSCLDSCPSFSGLHLYPMTACPRHCGVTPEIYAGLPWAWHWPVYCVSTRYSFLTSNSAWTDHNHASGCHPEFDFCFPIMP